MQQKMEKNVIIFPLPFSGFGIRLKKIDNQKWFDYSWVLSRYISTMIINKIY